MNQPFGTQEVYHPYPGRMQPYYAYDNPTYVNNSQFSNLLPGADGAYPKGFVAQFLVRDILKGIAETVAVLEGLRMITITLMQWFREVYGITGRTSLLKSVSNLFKYLVNRDRKTLEAAWNQPFAAASSLSLATTGGSSKSEFTWALEATIGFVSSNFSLLDGFLVILLSYAFYRVKKELEIYKKLKTHLQDEYKTYKRKKRQELLHKTSSPAHKLRSSFPPPPYPHDTYSNILQSASRDNATKTSTEYLFKSAYYTNSEKERKTLSSSAVSPADFKLDARKLEALIAEPLKKLAPYAREAKRVETRHVGMSNKVGYSKGEESSSAMSLSKDELRHLTSHGGSAKSSKFPGFLGDSSGIF